MERKNFFNFASLISSRAIYGLNWYNISPLYVLIESSFAIPLAELGRIPTAFLLGAGIFQIPAGLLAAKFGNKKIAVLGMYILSAMALMSGLSWDLFSISIFRFFLGMGAAMYFSPALGIIKNVFSDKSRGLAMGFYNGAFNLGAGIGLAIWGLIANFAGWRWALVIGGLLGLAITIENHIFLPKDPKNSNKLEWKTVLQNRNIWFLGMSLAGFWGAFFASAQFLDPYLVQSKLMNPDIVGFISSLTLITGAFGGPLIGMISDRVKKRKILLYSLAIAMALLISTIFTTNFITIWIYAVLIGIISAGLFSVLYAIPAGYKEVPENLLPLSIALINSVQISIGSIAPYLFTYVAARSSFTLAWISLGIYLIAFLPLAIFVKKD